MMWRIIKFCLYSVSFMLAVVAFADTDVHATEPKAYWDGPGKIVVKHPFFSHQYLDSDKDITEIDNSAEFKLDPYSRYPFRFKVDGISVMIKAEEYHCNYTGLYFDLTPEDDGTFTVKTKYSHASDAKGETGVDVSSSSIKGKWYDAFSPCEKAFVGAIDAGTSPLAAAVHEAVGDLKKPFKVHGKMGAVADITSFKEQTAASKENETKRYDHRNCGTFAARDPACASAAVEAYDVVWQYCEREAIALHEGKRRIEYFKSCIQNKSGVDIHATSFDTSALSRIDYSGGPSCSIRYIGWIICPLSRFMANVTDAAFEGLSDFFVIRPLDRDEDAGRALYRAWSLVNNIANVLFIVGFLIIIFSQLTGRGVTNYGIKKLLPKIILTAVLVNISYYLCIVAVDVSNILGASLKDVIKTIEPEAFTKPSTWTSEVENLLVFGGAAVGAAYIVLTGSIVAMLPLLLGALISLLIAVVMMVARYAIILLLIILAPIAIACTLLPNTQKWYNQWFKLFSTMLMLFPMVAIIFGASQVAGIIVLNSSLSRTTGDITLQLFGLAIMALPLAITPILVRLSGGVLNRFGGLVSNNKFFNKTRQRTDDFVKRTQNARDVGVLQRTGDKRRGGIGGVRDRIRQREYLRKAKHQLNEKQLGQSQSQYATEYAAGQHGGDKTSLLEKAKSGLPGYESKTKGEQFSADLAKGGISATAARAMEISAKAEVVASEVAAAKADPKIRSAMNPDSEGNMAGMVAIAKDETNSAAIRQAAIEIAMESGTDKDATAIVKAASKNTMNKDMRRAVAKGATSQNVTSQAAYFAQPGLERTIMSGEAAGDAGFTQNIVSPYYQSGEYSEMAVGTMGATSLEETKKAVSMMSPADRQMVAQTASNASQKKSIISKSRGGKAAIDKLEEVARM